jgi:DNA invertase Pin-like site-specific DNA recombinase
MGSFAEFEREMIRERTKLGLAQARLEGRVGGNRASLTPKQQAHALAMIDEGKSQSEVAEVFRVHRCTICRLVAERGVMERASGCCLMKPCRRWTRADLPFQR